MPTNCSSLTDVVDYAIADHTFTFENDKEVIVRDCAGAEQFRCDLTAHDLHMEAVETGGIWYMRLGRPVDLPIGTPTFVSIIDVVAPGSHVLFEKHNQNKDVDLIGANDVRYECVADTIVAPDNGYKRYSYRLSLCRVKLSVTSGKLHIECECESDPCTSEGHSGFRVTIALKP